MNQQRDEDRFYLGLKSKDDAVRRKAALDLRHYLDILQREALPASSTDYLEVYRRVVAKVTGFALQGNDAAERIGGIHALTALIDFKSDDAAQKTTRFANTFRSIMRGNDISPMIFAARAMGKLVQPGNPLTGEIVEAEVRSALEALQIDRLENRRFAAVITIRELAINAPTLLYEWVKPILEVIWVALRDQRVLIRESTAEAISACFEIIAARDAILKDPWFDRTYREINKGFAMGTVEAIHGSLLALKELLLKGGLYMQQETRYHEMCDKVFALKDHREQFIRKEIIALIPILGSYYPQVFSGNYLHKFMMHLQGQLKKGERNLAFVAIGKVASAVGSAIDTYLDGILVYVREGLSLKAKNRSTDDAPIFECISMIAIAVGQTLTKYMDALLDPIFECGLSDASTQALVDMAHYIPPARPVIQEKLLNLLSQILCGRPFVPLGAPTHNIIPANFLRDTRDPIQNRDRELETTLALQTLGSFDFAGYVLNEFVRDVAVRYVDDDRPTIRKAAALTCCQLFIKDPIVHQVSRHAIQVVGSVIEKLLGVAVADPDPEIRHIVLTSLGSRFDRHLAKAENVRTLFLALNDEVFENREAAVTIIGRLSSVNPAYVFPSLRKVLVQLLTEVEYSNNPRSKQESAQLISDLVRSSSRLIKPYVDPMVQVLLPKAGDLDENVASTALRAIGDLATVGGEEVEVYIDQLMFIVIRNLQDLSSTMKRSAALHTLGQLASNAGYVIQPYLDHPELLTILINIVKGEPPGDLRRETIRLIGILGALDPYKHQQVIEASPENNLAAEAASITDVSLIMDGMTPSNDEYYPTVVITTLMNLLKDPSLHQYHETVIAAVMNIYQTMGLKCIAFLNQVIPGFLTVIKEAPMTKVETYFSSLSKLVRIVRQHIRPHLPDILNTVQTFWQDNRQAHSTILLLIESIARSLEGEFKVYLARVLPLLLGVLDEDQTEKREESQRVLHVFLVFGSSAEEYMHLIIPVVIRMFDRLGQPRHIRKLAIESIGRISRQVNISEFAARIIQPLTRVMEGSDVELRKPALETICALIFQLGADYLHFVPTVGKVMVAKGIKNSNYTLLVSKLQHGEPLPQDLKPDKYYGVDLDDQESTEIATKPLAVNQEHLKNAWDASQRSTREDWSEWIKRLSVELLKESPQQALRACANLASVHTPTARALFNSAFISCYTLLFHNFQQDLVQNITIALTADNIPPEILQILLNLAEFMEHDDKALPIDVRTLGMYAGKCHAYAKALHYKELEFSADQSPSAVDALISINNSLQQEDAAFGILRKAQSYQEVALRETWYEKLNRWEDALTSYQKREAEEPYSFEVTMGKMRCLHALGEWDVLSTLAEDKWAHAATEGHQRFIAPLAAAAAWGLGQWEYMDRYLSAMRMDSPDRSFFGAIVSIHRNQFADAERFINKARLGLDTELSALLRESYNRAYSVIVRIQMLAELEEIIVYKQNDKNPEKQEIMRQTWTKRLKGCQRNVDLWQRMLKVRALVIKPEENREMWLKFANLCCKQRRFGLAEKSLRSVVPDKDEDLFDIPLKGQVAHQVSYGILKYMWAAPAGDQQRALDSMKIFTGMLVTDIQNKTREDSHIVNGIHGANGDMMDSQHTFNSSMGMSSEQFSTRVMKDWQKLLARCHVKQGQWRTALQRGDWQHRHVREILTNYSEATRYDPNWYKAWHAWALANFEVVSSYMTRGDGESNDIAPGTIQEHVVPAIQGFFRSIALSSTSSLQDTLRLLTLWFSYGNHFDVNTTVTQGIATVSVDTWLEVIPQLIARINQPSPKVRASIHALLCEVGRAHPQALVYPLTVSMKSDTARRSRSAVQIMESMRQHSPKLVEQASLVSKELIRIAVLWHEQWHEALEEASRCYFGENNIRGMFEVLDPLHDMLERGPETLREISFVQAFARDLDEAREWCNKYRRDRDVGNLNSAWDVYYQVFKKIARQLQQIHSLELQYVSPKLKNATNLDLALPGTYQSGKEVTRIASFEPVASVIQSKQRPRRFTMRGSDGLTYTYLLKGHEDIRQDERVMQLFGLINTLLSNDGECVKRHLNIQRYSAIPLSTQSGLLGWVPNSDTLHSLIRDYRENRKILLNIEHRIMLQMAPDYDNLTLMQKVEVFSYAMDNTTGQDLYRVLWLKSKSSESWLDRRTNYIRSLAVMSMVGYILGLGDRHPSNLMLDRITGKIIHIDFGDCFEVAQHREKYPERVPFRLTRMLTYAMEVSNIEGSFRTTCENVMRVLRDNKESLMAVLEAFIHDPLLTWRLNTRESPLETSFVSERRQSLLAVPEDADGVVQPRPLAAQAPQSLRQAGSLLGRPRTRSSATGVRPTNLNHAGNAGLNGTAVENGPTTAGAATTNTSGANAQARRESRPPDDADQMKEVQNARALQVLSRVKEKLTGRDFRNTTELPIEEQVQKLIDEATSLENLCQHYIGWCSFW